MDEGASQSLLRAARKRFDSPHRARSPAHRRDDGAEGRVAASARRRPVKRAEPQMLHPTRFVCALKD